MNTTTTTLDLDHYTDESNAWQLYGYTLTTHRLFHHGGGTDGSSTTVEFPYQTVAAAIAVAFFRTTVYTSNEPWPIRYVFATLLAALAYARKSYELIFAVQVFSYSFAVLEATLPPRNHRGAQRQQQTTSNAKWVSNRLLYGTVGLLASAALSYAFAHCLVTGLLLETLQLVTPQVVVRGFYYLIPVQECAKAYDMFQSLALPDKAMLDTQLAHLLFITFHIQTGMGFLGIHFLKQEQQRRNMLIRMDVDGDDDNKNVNEEDQQTTATAGASTRSANGPPSDKGATDPKDKGIAKQTTMTSKMARSRRFQRTAIPFIFRTAFPYMFQIIFYGNLNEFCFKCLHHDLHRTIRWHQPLVHDSHWIAMTQTPVSPEGEHCHFSQSLLVVHC